MLLSHKAGEKLFVDYAGQTVCITDPETGEIREAHIFVATLAASSYTYAEAQWSENLPNWIGGHVRALTFFGGVPEIIIPDNPKVGVKHPSRYEPDIPGQDLRQSDLPGHGSALRHRCASRPGTQTERQGQG